MRYALLLLGFGLLLRVLFWQATPDRGLPYAACYQGDAPYWQQLAAAEADPRIPQPTELKIPLRPPGTHWIVASLWNGNADSAWRVRLLFTLLGALVAPLLFLVLARTFPQRVALLAGGLCAAATGLMQLGSGVHGEIPYLLLFLLSMLDWQRMRAAPSAWRTGRWTLLHALATLVRAEHVLVWAGLLALLWWPRAQGRWRTAGLSVLVYGLCLLPWHLHAWSAIDRFNTVAPHPPERGSLRWNPEARDLLADLPAFLQQPAFGFIDATVRHRGGRAVTGDDVRALREAYGPLPGPLGRPFVALYGPLNFFLANSPEAGGGFTPAPLDRPPPLQGGAERYPPDWLQNLPRDGTLSLGYPPHVRYVNEGYRIGWEWIAGHPWQALRLVGNKLRYFWQGAASGLGGHALPPGASGTRRRVDLVTADGALATLWRLLVLGVCLLGAFAVRRDPAIRPWLWFLLAKVAVAAAFFGYARQGALCLPVIALLVATAIDRHLLARTPGLRWGRIGLLAMALLLALEALRCLSQPGITIDGKPMQGADPFPSDVYAVRAVVYR